MKHAEDDSAELGRQAEALGVPLDRGQLERLLGFESFLRDRAIPARAVAAGDVGRLRHRHILDSLRAAGAIRGSDRDALDLGSGAGLPGVVLAIARPGLRVGLVEPRVSRVALLELALAELELHNARVLARPARGVQELADVCLARALAPPARAWALAEPLLQPGGRLVYFAGKGVLAEVPGARIAVLAPPPVLESAGPLVIMTRE